MEAKVSIVRKETPAKKGKDSLLQEVSNECYDEEQRGPAASPAEEGDEQVCWLRGSILDVPGPSDHRSVRLWWTAAHSIP